MKERFLLVIRDEETRQRIKELARAYGGITEAIVVAVDRLYESGSSMHVRSDDGLHSEKKENDV